MSELSATTLEIDVTHVSTAAQLHVLLAEWLGFPNYYGRNWDAFDECVHEIAGPLVVNVKGFGGLRFRLPRDAKSWRQCIEDLDPSRVRFSFDVS